MELSFHGLVGPLDRGAKAERNSHNVWSINGRRVALGTWVTLPCCATLRILPAGSVAPALLTTSRRLCIDRPPLGSHSWSDSGCCRTWVVAGVGRSRRHGLADRPLFAYGPSHKETCKCAGFCPTIPWRS